MTVSRLSYLHVFTDCRVVKGYGRSIIADLTRLSYQFIPNDLADILEEYHHQPIEQLYTDFGPENSDTISDYLQFLARHEFVCFLEEDELELYPALDSIWAAPASITHATVSAEALLANNPGELLAELEATGCRALLVFAHNRLPLAGAKKLLEELQQRSFLVQWISPFTKPLFQHLVEQHDQLNTFSRLILFNAPMTELLHARIALQKATFHFSEQPKLINPIHATFFESLQHNLYFNRRVFVDASGNIRAGHSSATVLGTLADGFAQAARHPRLQMLSTASKAKTDVCRDCELRNICFDSREPQQHASGSWYHTTDCGYNPYINKWDNEPGYHTAAACGKATRSGHFAPDAARIEQLNAELWSA